MAAYCWVYDSRHLQADCQEPGSAPETYARQSSMGYFYRYLCVTCSIMFHCTCSVLLCLGRVLFVRKMLGWVVKEVSQAELGRNHSVLGRATFIFFRNKSKQQVELTELVSLEPFDDRPVRTVHGVVTLDQLVRDLSDRRPAVHRQTVRALVVVVKHQPHLPYRSTKHQLSPAVHSKLKVQN